MTLKQQIKDAKLLLGVHPGCRIVCKRKKKAPVKTKVMTSLEKPKGNEDEEALRKIEKANYIIRTEKPRVFDKDSEVKKTEKSDKDILKLIEDVIKKEIGKDIKQIEKVDKEKKILKDVETQTINEIVKEVDNDVIIRDIHMDEMNKVKKEFSNFRDAVGREYEHKEEKEGKEDEIIRKLKIENEIFRDAANAANDAAHKAQQKLKKETQSKNILSSTLNTISNLGKERIDERDRDKQETKENLLKLQQEIKNAQDELSFEIESRNANSHKATELRQLIRALKEEEHQFLQEEILGPRSSSSSSSLDRFIGQGKIGTGMTDQELDHIMKDEPYYQNCISADEIHTLKPAKKMEFIINTDIKSGPGKHWCACYIDIDGEKEIDYYDPLADDPTERFRHDIQKYLIDKLDPKTLLKFKINKVIDQRSDTDTCGLMCVNFLKKRNRGINFKDATGYKEPHINKTEKFEKEANLIRKQAGFGFI